MTDFDRSAQCPRGGLAAQPVRLLAIGDLVPENDHGRLLEAFAGVVRWNQRARLIIVGEGPERGALEAQLATLELADHVGLPGRVNLPHLAEWMQRAHVFVSAPREPLGAQPPGLAVAMAGGLCIVATSCGGSGRMLDDGVTALLVDPDDDLALTRALHLAVSNGELREELGAAAAASVRGGLRKSA